MSTEVIRPDHTSDYAATRKPLISSPYLALPLGAVRPAGFLHEQLRRMAGGLTGRLDTLYAEVLGDRNGWLGGDGDVWERGPYWLDGLVPLAYLLQDERLIAKARPWIEWTLASQREDGSFGPRDFADDPEHQEGLQRDKAGDWWPRMVMLKVLQQYYTATRDERVIRLMLRYFRYQLEQLPEKPLDHWSWWSGQRGGDNQALVYWLYNITGEEFLLTLGDLLYQQTVRWEQVFTGGGLREKFTFHGVNVAHGIKQPVVNYQRTGDPASIRAVKQALEDLKTFHGHPNGLFSSDEWLHGTDPTHGAELCTATELMYSLETVMAITGDVDFMDHLEKIAFNALPAQATDDYDARQYYQQPNQVMITRRERNFVTQHGHSDLCFGVLTGYPCCTVNMHQGWPKYVQALWHATADGGLAALVYGPSEVTARIGSGEEVRFTEDTRYPFEETVRFRFSSAMPVSFPLHLRIPSWCGGARITLNGERWSGPVESGTVSVISRLWLDGDVVELELPMEIRTSTWHERSLSVEHGPLVYALKIAEEWMRVENDDKHGPYLELFPGSPWNFGLLKDQLRSAVVERHGTGEAFPWNIENAPVTLKVKGKRIPSWTLYNDSAGPQPFSPHRSADSLPEEELTLVPYGCTKLRISEFPEVQ